MNLKLIKTEEIKTLRKQEEEERKKNTWNPSTHPPNSKNTIKLTNKTWIKFQMQFLKKSEMHKEII